MILLATIFMNCCIILPADNNGKWENGKIKQQRGIPDNKCCQAATSRGGKSPKKEAGTPKDGRCHEHNK